jgi:hypothetical protein
MEKGRDLARHRPQRRYSTLLTGQGILAWLETLPTARCLAFLMVAMQRQLRISCFTRGAPTVICGAAQARIGSEHAHQCPAGNALCHDIMWQL